MSFKLEYDTVHRIQKISQSHVGNPKTRELRFGKVKANPVSVVEILKSFGITSLVLLNITILGFALLWFSLLFTIVTPLELADMMVTSADSTVVVATTPLDFPSAPSVLK